MVIGGIESAAQDPEAISPDPTNIVNENAQQSAPPGPSGDRQKPGKALGGGGRAELQPDFEHLLSSPAIKKFLELMRENMELVPQIKILGIQSESKMRMHDMELKVEQLRRELNESNAALKDATLSKERLESRISNLSIEADCWRNEPRPLAARRIATRMPPAIRKSLSRRAYLVLCQSLIGR